MGFQNHRLRTVALLLGFGLLSSGMACADDIDLIDTLHHNHVISDQQYRQLRQQAERKAAENSKQKAEPAQHAASSVSLMPKIGGYAQLDAPLSVSDAGTIGSRTVLRRFYLQVHGDLALDWLYGGSFGYYNGATYFDSASLDYTGFRFTRISGGYFKEPFSLSYLTSAENLALAEPALPSSAMVPGKKIGLMASSHGTRWSVTGGIFGSSYDQTADAGVEGRWGVSLRATVLPWRSRDGLWELGGSVAWREADSDHKASFGYRPETFVVASKLANAALTNVDDYTSGGLETQLQWHSIHFQGEYLLTNVDRDHAQHLTFRGWYAQTGWLITGERRKLSDDALPGGVAPRHPLLDGGWGAWELAARYSVLDLNDADVSGGRERNASVGVNWYPQGTVKLMLDWIRVLPMQGGAFPGEDSNIVMARMQFAY